MRLAVAIVTLLGATAFANPVATADATKVWERCIAAVSRNQAQVSCAIGYTTRSQPADPLYIAVPVFVPQSTPKERFADIIRARLEFDSGGSAHTPIRYEDRGVDGAPAGMKLIDCVFVFGRAPARAFSLVVSYQQPIQDGQFWYRPEFEDRNQPRDAKSYSVTVFPMGDTTIELVSPRSPADKVLATRITVTPQHRKFITIAVR